MLKKAFSLIALVVISTIYAYSQPAERTKIDLTNKENFEILDAGDYRVTDEGLLIKGAYAAIGENNWTDYSFEFDAGAPALASEVQIWAGFRAGNRDDRYVLALKGVGQNDLYLSRLGFMGADDFLALKHLEFALQKDQFYHIKVEVAGNRIRVFLGSESLPRIDVVDKDASLAPKGKITLGGGWLPAIYKNLKVKKLSAQAFDHVASEEFAAQRPDKEALRARQRKSYRDIDIAKAQNLESGNKLRQKISLNGNWLFAPDYMIQNGSEGYDPKLSDDAWHIMTVPAFWNPSRIWLFGEDYGPASKGVSDSYYQKETDRCEAYSFDYKRTKVGWYRQWVDVPAKMLERHIELAFDAVSKTSEVWVNGKKAGGHIGMFGAFNLDISSLLKPGKNLIAVKVGKEFIKNKSTDDPNKVIGIAASVVVTPSMLNDLPHGFFGENPAGIWQPVSIIVTDPVHINDVFIQADTTSANLEITIENKSRQAKSFQLETKITGAKTAKLLFEGKLPNVLTVAAGATKTFKMPIDQVHPDLWSPENPNLYDFRVSLIGKGKGFLDQKTVRSGFKSFVIKDGHFYLNGHPYWLRGGNQSSMPLEPNDTLLARTFSKLAHAGNMMVTRTHTTPYTEAWMDASDAYGVGVSFEGTWPWLMLGDTEIPDERLLDVWKKEMIQLVKKYRNHPSLLLWTVNNEMKFYVLDPNEARAKLKMRIVSDMVKMIRETDPNHPVVFDSNYFRKQVEKRLGKAFIDSIDDGDVDDIHQYPNWYDESIFLEFDGRFQRNNKTAGRPLISQEMSTGYPDETGHATRFYTFVHQNPSSLVGKFAYAYQDPKWFMRIQSFITKEVGEALRRSNPDADGVLHFSQATWFKHVYDAKQIEPNRTYYAMQKVLQPVLVTAELWGRHFYGGRQLPTRICIVNDQVGGGDLHNVKLVWQLVDDEDKVIASGNQLVEKVAYYGRHWVTPTIQIPASLPTPKVNGKLKLTLYENDQLISHNDYDLVFATRNWAGANKADGERLRLLDLGIGISSQLKDLGQAYTKVSSVKELLATKKAVAIIAAADTAQLSSADLALLKAYIGSGGKLLMVHGVKIAQSLFPKEIKGTVASNKEITNIEIPESALFQGIAPLDIRYFNDNQAKLPTVLNNSYQINRNPQLAILASSVQIHGYLSGNTAERRGRLEILKGFPILSIGGHVILTTLSLEKSGTDPIAGKLLTNMIKRLSLIQ